MSLLTYQILKLFQFLFIEVCIVIYWTECDTIIMLLSICHSDCNHSIVWIIFFCIFDVSIALCVFCHSSIYICALILLHFVALPLDYALNYALNILSNCYCLL